MADISITVRDMLDKEETYSTPQPPENGYDQLDDGNGSGDSSHLPSSSPSLDLTDFIFDISRYPTNSSGAFCDIYLGKLDAEKCRHRGEVGGAVTVALKRLRLTGSINSEEKAANMCEVEKVRLIFLFYDKHRKRAFLSPLFFDRVGRLYSLP